MENLKLPSTFQLNDTVDFKIGALDEATMHVGEIVGVKFITCDEFYDIIELNTNTEFMEVPSLKIKGLHKKDAGNA